MYCKVDDKEKIKQIEKNGNWKVYESNSENEYILLEQRDADNNPTDFYKVIERSKAKMDRETGNLKVYANSNDDWIYYERKLKI